MRIGIMLRHIEQQEGGVKVYTQNILPRLVEKGSQHTFVLMYQNPKLRGTYARYPNVEEMAFNVPGTVTWDQLGVPIAAWARNLDVIFNPKLTVPILGNAKKVFVQHGAATLVIPTHFKPVDIWYRKVFRPLYFKRAEACVAVSNAVKSDLVKYTAIDAAKVFPIHNGMNPEQFQPVTDAAQLRLMREKYQLPERFILWAGQIESRKNVGRLLQAFAQIKDEIPHTLVIAGERRWSALRELGGIDQLGISDRVHMPGWVPHSDLPALYSLAECFVFPSLYEGFGIPLIEAMACGCPVIAANTCSPPEVLGGAGRLFDPLNVPEMAAAIKTVVQDEDLRRTMRAEGIKRAREFSWDRCADELLAVLERAGSAKS